MNDFIIKLLDLKEKDLDFIESITKTESSDFIIILKRSIQVCPHCGSLTDRIKDYKIRKLNHKVLIHSHSFIFYKQRRYCCKDCGKSFVEYSPFTGTRHILTASTVINILNDLKPYTSTFSSVAKKYGVSVSTVVDIFDRHVQIKRKTLTHILCFDEFYFNRHAKKKYAFMIMDFSKKYIIDIVESRWSEDLYDYFFHIPLEERNQVKYIIIDMYSNYKFIIHNFFKSAIICVDPFHVVKKVNDSLNQVRKRIMKKYSTDELKNSVDYKLLKSRYYIILKNEDSLNFEKFYYDRVLGYTTTELGLKERILQINPTLNEAYKIKEEYINFNNENQETFDIDKKTKEFDSLIKRMKLSNIQEMIECAKTLTNWKQEILNSFHWYDGRRLSNGPIEGKNNYIKKIISNANGLSNFKRARNKFIYSQNQYEKYLINENKESIKRIGNYRGKYKKRK